MDWLLNHEPDTSTIAQVGDHGVVEGDRVSGPIVLSGANQLASSSFARRALNDGSEVVSRLDITTSNSQRESGTQMSLRKAASVNPDVARRTFVAKTNARAPQSV